ncbi:MAG TPA: alpha/beta fold hydrolase [Burkholderiales bacterium]
MSKIFLDYDQKALDDQYEQRVWVPHADQIIRRFGTASDAVRSRIGEPGTQRYGPAPIETLDVYGSGRRAFVFVHGGAWRRQSKRENAFAAEMVVRAGAAYVALDFALLPSVTLDEMVAQVCRGIEWVYRNLSQEIVLCGHSSGGHLGGCAVTRLPFLKSALLVSGIYDLLPVRLSARNSYVRLDERLEHEYSPIRHIEKIRCPVTVSWAEHEAAEFARQSREFAARLGAPAIVGYGMNHFEIIETLADPRSPLGAAALQMLTSADERTAQ